LEAIETCQTIHSLGHYYLGEANYWIAWNQNELEKYEDAFHFVTKAQYYLEGFSDVNLLKGLICYELEMLEEAEINLEIALELDPQTCEALFTLEKSKRRHLSTFYDASHHYSFKFRCPIRRGH
jgi:tetratricopeptide (TPR) repeat protein